MDSWTDQQLGLMKAGGNDKCNDYLKKHGIDARCPIKQKYESDAAQLYKQVLKARAEGRPEPTKLEPPKPRQQPNSFSSSGGGGGGGGAGDPNGMERLVGETDQQYVARQTRLREEAKARMAAKFGNSGGLGGVGSGGGGGGGRMQGIGSDPNYNPNGGNGGLDVDSLVSGVGSLFNSARESVKSAVSEENVAAVKSTGASFWGSLTTGVSTVASTIDSNLASTVGGGGGGAASAEDGSGGIFGGSDGLAQLQRQVASQRPAQSKYTGFGSSQQEAAGAGAASGGAPGANSSGLQECPGLPGEDRDGIARLTGESDEQYVIRQTRLRDEARARMAAKFGSGGMGGSSAMTSVSSNSFAAPSPMTKTSSNGSHHSGNSFSASSPARPATAPSSGNSANYTPTTKMNTSAPSSGNGKALNSDDFFSSFGT